MLKLAQFRNKIKTHGLLPTLGYTAEYVVRPLWKKVWVEPLLKSYSQRYEDVIIDKILGHKKNGVYLDIGAYDPRALSNTKRFYDRGWRGCNIEPNPRRFQEFVKQRPRDINLNVGLSESAGRLTFFDVAPEALATFSEERVNELRRMGAKIRRQVDIPVITLSDVFTQHFKDVTVDFCSIDTEGMDLPILRGNDWSRFKPRVICVEVSITQSPEPGIQQIGTVERFLTSVGYAKHSQTSEFGVVLNEIYVAEE